MLVKENCNTLQEQNFFVKLLVRLDNKRYAFTFPAEGSRIIQLIPFS